MGRLADMLALLRGCAVNPETQKRHPIDLQRARELGRAVIVSTEQEHAFSKFFSSLQENRRRPLSVIAIGGSVVAGTGCTQRTTERVLDGPTCSFAMRFAQWLNCTSRASNLTSIAAINRGRGGITTASALPLLPVVVRAIDDRDDLGPVADLLLIDFSANDASFGLYQNGSKGLYREDANVTNSLVAGATEIMLRFLLTEHPHLPILLIESNCKDTPTRRSHKHVAAHYQVPFVSYGDQFPDEHCFVGEWSHRKTHPDYKEHQSIADYLSVWWTGFGSRWLATAPPRGRLPHRGGVANLPPPLTRDAARAPFTDAVCRKSVSRYDSRDWYRSGAAIADRGGVRVQNWTLEADRPNKPGWITYGPSGATIDFDLSFGASPRLIMLFEEGYEGWGDANLFLGSPSASRRAARSFPLRGMRADNERVTQARLLNLDVGMDTEGGRNDFQVAPFSRHTLHVVFEAPTPQRTKFKIQHVSTC